MSVARILFAQPSFCVFLCAYKVNIKDEVNELHKFSIKIAKDL